MECRRGVEVYVVGPGLINAGRVIDIGDNIPVREHYAFRLACRTGRVKESDEVAFSRVCPFEPRGSVGQNLFIGGISIRSAVAEVYEVVNTRQFGPELIDHRAKRLVDQYRGST